MIPKIAKDMGVNPVSLVLPMHQASTIARPLSPVAGVVIAIAGMLKIDPLELNQEKFRSLHRRLNSPSRPCFLFSRLREKICLTIYEFQAPAWTLEIRLTALLLMRDS